MAEVGTFLVTSQHGEDVLSGGAFASYNSLRLIEESSHFLPSIRLLLPPPPFKASEDAFLVDGAAEVRCDSRAVEAVLRCGDLQQVVDRLQVRHKSPEQARQNVEPLHDHLNRPVWHPQRVRR
jgi:hypothetical protein